MRTRLFLKAFSFIIIVAVLSVVIVGCGQNQQPVWEKRPSARSEGHRIKLEELPEAAWKAMRKHIPALTTINKENVEIEKGSKDGQTIYKMRLMANYIKYEFEIAEDGSPIETQMKWTFDKEQAGAVPQWWAVAETQSAGKPAKWQVIWDDSAPSKSQVVAITETRNSGHTFNLLMANQTRFKNGEVEVMVKALSGEQDQGGGPIWRVQDPNNYYIARWNPLEDNFRVYFVKDGRRKQLASADVKADPKAWHKIQIKHKKNKIVAKLDGKKLIEVEDTTFTKPGNAGLWTKADAVTAFDDFKVKRKGGKKQGKTKKGRLNKPQRE